MYVCTYIDAIYVKLSTVCVCDMKGTSMYCTINKRKCCRDEFAMFATYKMYITRS
jgi:hypothetical protein